ncbi:MAG: AraC family transcriptional regulator [Motiliproteus sp.]
MHNDKNHDKTSTLGTWVRMIATALRDQGADPEAVFKAAGLDLNSTASPDVRIPDSQLRHLYPRCAEACNDPHFGLHLGRYLHADSLHALGFALLSSNDIKDVLVRFTRYSRMISDSADAELVKSGANFCFEVAIYRDGNGLRLIPHEGIDAFFSGLLNLLQELTGTPLHPVKVALARPVPPDSMIYQQHFLCPVEFDAPKDLIEFSPTALSLPIRSANRSLAIHQDQLIEAYIAELSSDFDQQVFRQIAKLLPAGELSPERLASGLHMSLRNLQHKLQQLDTSYQQLLDRVRQQQARQLLKSAKYSITEIAFLVGFSNSANFSRAFKRWSGQSPAQYRKQQSPSEAQTRT